MTAVARVVPEEEGEVGGDETASAAEQAEVEALTKNDGKQAMMAEELEAMRASLRKSRRKCSAADEPRDAGTSSTFCMRLMGTPLHRRAVPCSRAVLPAPSISAIRRSSAHVRRLRRNRSLSAEDPRSSRIFVSSSTAIPKSAPRSHCRSRPHPDIWQSTDTRPCVEQCRQRAS